MINEALRQGKLLELYNSYLDSAEDWRDARDTMLKDFTDVLAEELGLTFSVVTFDKSLDETKKVLQKICDKL